MNTNKNRTVSLFHNKEIIKYTFFTATIFAVVLALYAVSATAETKGKGRKVATSRAVKSSQSLKKDFNDPNLDTITITNRNVGDFKKGFVGDNAVSAVSNSPFYKLSVIAKQGSQDFTDILSGSTLNSNGLVSFAGVTSAGRSIFAGDTENSSRSVVPFTAKGRI
jgi:hypothetical protein